MQATSISWRAEDLGQPIPADLHAVSVCLPRWRDNIGYEENDPAVIATMKCGYPRFFIHPAVNELFAECERRGLSDAQRGEQCAFAFPSMRVAERCVQFLQRRAIPARSVSCFDGQTHAVFLPQKHRPEAKAFWQHSGDLVSSRQAIALLSCATSLDATQEKTAIRERVAEIHGCPADDVWLFPSGMSAISFTHRLFQKMRPTARSVQFGFPYVDILKIQERFANPGAPEVAFYPRGCEEDLKDLEALARQEKLQGLFVEIPGNPLLTSPNIIRLGELTNLYDFPLMVDDTLAACTNLETLGLADIVCTSLTKYFSGAGNVIAGALILNRECRHASTLRELLETEFEDLLYAEDAIVLEKNSRDFASRIPRVNDNALELVEFLQDAPEVEHVYYPSLAENSNYTDLMRPGGGYGGLLSIVLRDAADNTPRFFDALQLAKGPNLGTSFTLCCPYTILAHYNELEFVESLGVSRYLIRVSVGLEDSSWIIDRFQKAMTTPKDKS